MRSSDLYLFARAKFPNEEYVCHQPSGSSPIAFRLSTVVWIVLPLFMLPDADFSASLQRLFSPKS
jgi:hypothetical protein